MRSDSVSGHDVEPTVPGGPALGAGAGSGGDGEPTVPGGRDPAAAPAPSITPAGAETRRQGPRDAGGPRSADLGEEDRAPVPVAARISSVVIRNPVFCGLLLLAALLRVIVMAGFRPAVLIRLDSYIYLVDATRWVPDPDNTNGYPFFLWLLKPAHSLALIAALQHVMGLGVAVLIYAILRRFRVPRWAATIAALPTLFDPRALLIEHSVMADTLAVFLLVAAFATLLIPRRPSVWSSGAAGLLLGLSCVVRPTVLPLLVLFTLFLLLTRAGWRKALAVLVAGALPVASYAAWFAASYGVFNLTNSSGLFLWARTMTFANCAIIKPPADLRPLCPDRNPALPGKARPNPRSWQTLLQQQDPQDFLWSRDDWPWQPRPAGYVPYQVAFTPAKNARAQQFALRAIAAQPADYATVVAEGVALTFLKTDHVWQFRRSHPAPAVIRGTTKYEMDAVRAYAGGTAGVAPYVGHHIVTRSVTPYATFISHYQRVVYLPGLLFAALFAIGLAGIFSRRGRSGAAALIWVSAVIVLVLPIAENQFNYRYALAAVPLTAMSAALVTADRRRPSMPSTARTPAGAAEDGAAAQGQPADGAAADGAAADSAAADSAAADGPAAQGQPAADGATADGPLSQGQPADGAAAAQARAADADPFSL